MLKKYVCIGAAPSQKYRLPALQAEHPPSQQSLYVGWLSCVGVLVGTVGRSGHGVPCLLASL